MTDYSKLTDHEINKLVAKKLNIDIEESHAFFNGGDDILEHYSSMILHRKITNNKEFWKTWNPCGDWDDAGPIIEKYKISLISYGTGWEATVETDHYQKQSGEYTIFSGAKSPLRSAMIVFLMMKETENER